jgi:hypothetical protein
MAVGGKKEEYDYNPPEDNLEWWCEWKLNIREIRMIYDSINYYSSIWPGPPERPEQEKQFLENYKVKLFTMITDYNYANHEVEGD